MQECKGLTFLMKPMISIMMETKYVNTQVSQGIYQNNNY
jgi:hypothetical protein